MSALPFGTFISPRRSLFESGSEPMSVSSLVGVSSINGSLYPPVTDLPTFLPTVEITAITGVSTINDSVYPPPSVSSFQTLQTSSITGVSTINGEAYPPSSGSGLLIQSGSFGLSNNGQTITYPTPYTSTVSVVVQGTANAAGVNGFFTVATYGSRSDFRVFYSGELIYGPIEMFWIASGV